MNGDTISDATRKLFNFFEKEEILILKDDIKKINLISIDEEVEKAIYTKALNQLVEQNVVSLIETKKGSAYVLNKPLKEYSQNIELNFQTVEALTNTINTLIDESGQKEGKVNPLNVTENDIQKLIIIIENLYRKIKENE